MHSIDSIEIMNIFKKKYSFETNEIFSEVDNEISYRGFTLTAKILNDYERTAEYI